MRKYSVNDDFSYCSPYFVSGYFDVIVLNRVRAILREMFEKIICSFNCYTTVGSGWSLLDINILEMTIIKMKKCLSGG